MKAALFVVECMKASRLSEFILEGDVSSLVIPHWPITPIIANISEVLKSVNFCFSNYVVRDANFCLSNHM